MGMRVLVDADTLLEYILHRSKFVGEVESLFDIYDADSSIELYLSSFGIKKILEFINPIAGKKRASLLIKKIKKRIKILRITRNIATKAQSTAVIDYESAVEICLAIQNNIGVIITDRPESFDTAKINIVKSSDFKNYIQLENTYSKEINELPVVLKIDPKVIHELNRAYYELHDYTKPSKSFKLPANRAISSQSSPLKQIEAYGKAIKGLNQASKAFVPPIERDLFSPTLKQLEAHRKASEWVNQATKPFVPPIERDLFSPTLKQLEAHRKASEWVNQATKPFVPPIERDLFSPTLKQLEAHRKASEWVNQATKPFVPPIERDLFSPTLKQLEAHRKASEWINQATKPFVPPIERDLGTPSAYRGMLGRFRT